MILIEGSCIYCFRN